MLYLNSNSTAQSLFLTLQDAARDYSYTHYLFKLVHRMSKEEHYFVADTPTDNPRYTEVEVATNGVTINDILLTETGDYDYYVYVQNSSTNKDPESALVEGMVEQGTLRVPGASPFTVPTLDTVDAVIFYSGN